MTQPALTRVTVGIDTHLDVHVAHAKDALGRRVETVSIPTTPAGYRDLLAWARGLGEVEAFGIEGTGSYGAALARFLRSHGQVVLEVNRPDRSARRRHGKSDPVDAEAAARTVTLRRVRAWLTPWVVLGRWWRAWSGTLPPAQLGMLLDAVGAGQPLHLYLWP